MDKGKVMPYELLADEPKQEEGLGKQLVRGAIQTGARAFETLAGTPGNILSTGLGALNYVSSKVNPERATPTYEELQKSLPVSFPTTSQLREATQRLTGTELEPQTELGKRYNNAVETVTSLVTPMGSLGKGFSLGTAIKGALSGEALSYLAEQLGGSDTTQGVAKLVGTLGGTLAFRGKDLAKTAAKNYKELEKSLQPINIPSKTLRQGIDTIAEKYGTGDSPAKKFAIERLSALDNAIQGDKVNAKKLWDLKKNANEYYANANSSERKVLKDIIDLELKSLKEIGPEYQKLELADKIHKTFLESGKVTQFLQKHAPSGISYVGWIKPLFFGTSKLAGQLPTAVAGYAGYKIANEGRMLADFLSSAPGRRYYAQVLKNGFSGHARDTAKSIAKLNQAAQEFDKQNNPAHGKYELLD